MFGLLQDYLRFLKTRKKLWIAPVFVILFLFGAVFVLTQGSVVAPFIYTLF